MIKQTTFGGFGALVYEPDGYQHVPGSPAWLFLPGQGEVKGGTEALYKHNTFGHIRDKGYRPGFVVAAVSPGKEWIQPAEILLAVKEFQARYPGCKIVANGLSMGAWAWENYVFSKKENGDTISAMVVMSGPIVDYSGAANMKGKPVLGIVGDADSLCIYHQRNVFSALKAGGADAVNIEVRGEGHAGWAQKYDPAYRGAEGKSIYDWVHERLGKLPEVPQEPPGRRLIAKITKTITFNVYDDGTTEEL